MREFIQFGNFSNHEIKPSTSFLCIEKKDKYIVKKNKWGIQSNRYNMIHSRNENIKKNKIDVW